MRFVHAVCIRFDEKVVRALQRCGFHCSRSSTGMGMEWLFLDIDEADSRWPAAKAILHDHGVSTTVRTEFTSEELRAAQWLSMDPLWHHGYPMPDNDFAYLDLTYDLTEYCRRCGIGACQKAPFRMRREPKWGRRAILQLNWVFDEYFVRPEVWNAVFKPLGIECRPVLAHKTERELTTVVQLRIDRTLGFRLDLRDHLLDVCEFCQRLKYLPFVRGMLPAMSATVQGTHIVKSSEWFGSGASAFREVFVTAELYGRLQDATIRGVLFKPLGQSKTGQVLGQV